MPFPKAIITKPFLVSDSEYKDLGLNINLVGYDSFSQVAENTKQHASPRLLNWVEPYEISGVRKTLFYTEVNTNFQVGDRVYIVNGNYDNDSLIKKDKYKKGRDGYKVLRMEQCKVVLDIDYTGALPYNDDSLDDYVKVYYIDNLESFVNANRRVTTRGGKFDYKFNYYQNNIAFIDKDFPSMDGWGLNAGVSGTPGFFVREGKDGWSKITDEFAYLGSFSVALSPTYKNNGKILIMDGTFIYNGIEFKEGFSYKWEVGPTSSSWMVDVSYSPAIITKSNFRNGTFNGKFNNGLYGTQQNKLDWSGKGTWNGGSMLNTLWQSGTIDSKIGMNNTYKAVFDEYGIPFQKSHTNNNGGFGFNYIFDSEIRKSLVNNGNFYNTSFNQISVTFSVVENHILSITQSFDNRVIKAYFDFCNFVNIQIDGGELKNVRSLNSKFSNVKSINSYFDKSVLKDSTYISDKLIKILGYDEWNMSEYKTLLSGSFSSINDVNSKIYKFYISKENYKRLKTEDTFYIKGIKIKNSPTLTDFFDNKFKLTSWTEFYDDTNSTMVEDSIEYFFYKRGYECSAFLSTPEENAYIINSSETLLNVSGATISRYTTLLSGENSNAAYSIDIIVSRHDLYNKNRSTDTSSDWDALNPKNFNYSSDVIVGTTSLPAYLGDNIDIKNAYILDSNFESGIIETSDWNSGHHINYNNDVVITAITASGIYNLEIDNDNDYLIATTNLKYDYPEKIGKYAIENNDIVFLNSIDYDTRGMVTKVTLIATGSSYSTTSDPAYLVNTKVSSLTMSNVGTYYTSGFDLPTYNKTGVGTGLTIDITAKPIGSVISITYSAPMSGGGSYSMNLLSNVSTNTGIISTASFVSQLLIDDALGTVTGITAIQNGGFPATYSTFGPPFTPQASGATGVGVVFLTGPTTLLPGGSYSFPTTLGAGLTLNYKTSANGAITYLEINDPGIGYDINQVFKIEGGSATFSIKSVGKGEITNFSIKSSGEDYLTGDVLDILKPYDPNFQFGAGITASVIVTSITVSNKDTRGLALNLFTGTGPLEGSITDITINKPGLYYNEGEIFTIDDGKGNLDALVRIDSVTGSVTRLNDTYKVINNDRGVLTLKDLGKQNIIAGLTANGSFYTTNAMNRWGYISKTKIDRTKIKSGIFKRPYIVNSLIRDIDYDSTDRNFANFDKIKNLVISDSLFNNNSNILSSATYIYSNLVGGNDIWNDGIINKSVINGLTFSKGTIRQATWIDGNFTGGMFFYSKSFDAMPTLDRPNYLSDRVRSYYMTGKIGPTLSNNRYSWRNGTFSGGQFYKSDWEGGNFNNGLFYYSKFYNGTINGGKIGTRQVAASDTKVYNGVINYTTVDNASVYSEDTSYTGLSSSNILWHNGIFNNGLFGSNNDDLLGTTFSNLKNSLVITSSFPIADFKITTLTQPVGDNNPILGNFEIDVVLDIKHTYLGDLIVNLMSPNGKIINLKKRYSCGSNDNLLSTTFTSDSSKPSIEIGTPPYTGEFRFDALLNEGVYYDLNNRLLPNISYVVAENIIPEVIDYRSFPPTNFYEGDRYLVIATASDPNWTSTSPTTWLAYVGGIVEKSTGTIPELYIAKNNDKVFVKSKSEYLKFFKNNTFEGWTKSYHSNTTRISEMLNTNKTVTGNWTLMVMDCASLDSGFVENFDLNFTYKTSYIIKSFKNDATWYNGIFNGGQFIDLGVWKNGKFNGGKFISTYGYERSGSYLSTSENILDYSWQAGEFNGGEFGNESLLANSTWFNGEFNGGTFKGKLWKNGVFTYGEFKGGASLPAIGNGIKSENAQTFIDSFKTEYYGVWVNGVVSDKKDNFVTDKKIFTEAVRAMAPVKLGKTAKFSNIIWKSGTFNHPSGEINNSVWLNGLFKMGTFKTSAFNPYVTRTSDAKEFVKDDSCIWENGKLIDSEFHISKWKYGHFISGTAVGMIWQNGITNYMNAYNIFWENGVWRNGNWYGSNFEYRGKVEDGMAKEILNRGVEWSGTSSCHIWNIFETDVDTTILMAKTAITGGGDSFTTTNQDDAGYQLPDLGTLTIVANSSTQVTISFMILTNNGAPIKEAGVILIASNNQNAANSAVPSISTVNSDASSPQYLIATPNPPTTKTSKVAGSSGMPTYTPGNSTTGITEGQEFSIQVSGLDPSKFYSVKGFATNAQSAIVFAAAETTYKVFQTVKANDPVAILSLTYINPSYESTGIGGSPATGESYYTTPTFGISTNQYQQVVKKAISLSVTYGFDASTMPAPATTPSSVGTPTMGIVYKRVNVGVSEPSLTVSDGTMVTFIANSNTTSGNTGGFNVKISETSVLANGVYYIKAFTKNAGGVSYSPTMKITSGTNPPVLGGASKDSTKIISSLTSNGAVPGLSVNLKRGFAVTSTNTAPSIRPSQLPISFTSTSAKYEVDSSSTETSFEATISAISSSLGLSPGQPYWIRAYAYNPDYDFTNTPPGYNSFAYGTSVQFNASSTSPSVTTTTPVSLTNITETGATLGGNITNINGSPITNNGVVWKTAAGSYPADPTTMTITINEGYFAKLPITTTGPFTILNTTINTLAEGQKYFFKAYAKNSIGIGFGTEGEFTTKAKVVVDTLTSTANSITPAMTVTRIIPVTYKGIIWSTSSTLSGLTIASLDKTIDADSVTTSTPSTLSANTVYYIRGYVTNDGGTYYETSTTPVTTLPAFFGGVTNTITEGSTTATIATNMAVTNIVIQGPATLTAKGIAYSTTSNGTYTSVPCTPVDITKSNYITNITGLATGTKYYFKPYATNAGGTGYGVESEFTTLVALALPTTPTSPDVVFAAGVTEGLLTVTSVTVTNEGSSSIGYGLCSSNNGSTPQFTGPPTTTGVVTTSFVGTITLPTPSGSPVTYKVKAYAENTGGIAYSPTTITITIDSSGTVQGGIGIS